MLHFACHCQEGKRGDTLLISFIKDEEIEENALVLELETYKFLLRQGQFLCQPLVFLNACQSAGGLMSYGGRSIYRRFLFSMGRQR